MTIISQTFISGNRDIILALIITKVAYQIPFNVVLEIIVHKKRKEKKVNAKYIGIKEKSLSFFVIIYIEI